MYEDMIGIGGAISPYGNNVVANDFAVEAVASGILPNSNPPYLLSDFLTACPQFGGVVISATGTATSGSNILTGVTNAANIAVGALLIAVGTVPDGTTVTAVDATTLTVTLSANATASGTVGLTVYSLLDSSSNPLVPLFWLQAYLGMAMTVINEARFKSYWPLAMSCFIGHFCTLYLMSVAQGAGSSAAKVIANAQARGLDTSVSADVSVSTDYATVCKGIEGWGSFLLTMFGQQLATLGQMVGRGGMYVR